MAAVAKALATAASALAQVALALQGETIAERTEEDTSDRIGAPRFARVRPNFSTAVEPLTLVEAINEFLVSKSQRKISDRYLHSLETALRSFARGRCNQMLQTITVADIEQWLMPMRRDKTRATYLGSLRSFFRWCVIKKPYLKEDITTRVDIPEGDDSDPPNPYTPEETRKILHWLAANHPNLCRRMAIRFFAGLRTAEAERCGEENILLEQGYVEVTRHMSKTKRRRLVKIEPNLRAWLALDGELCPISADTIRQCIKAAGVEPRRNGTRSAFISYHLAREENIERTAHQAGNSKDVIETNYKALKTEAEAREYFDIYPPEKIVPATKPIHPGRFQKGWRKIASSLPPEELADVIKAARRAGSAAKMAAFCGVSESTALRWLNGAIPRPEMIAKLREFSGQASPQSPQTPPAP